jgi:predicted lipid carrier protein YhbT
VATKQQVEAKLRALIRRLEAAEEGKEALARALPQTRVIQVEVPDLGQTYWTELSAGRMGKLRRGESPGADIRIRADSDELIHMVDGKRSLFSSYIGGRVKIEASFADLMRLRKLA